MSATLTARQKQPTRLGQSGWLRLGLLCTGVAFALATLALERSHALGSFAGRSISADVIEGTAAVALVLTGVISWDGGASGPLLVLAAFAWLLPEWTNPQAELAPLFTLGLAGVGATAALMTHLGLAHPGSAVATRGERL